MRRALTVLALATGLLVGCAPGNPGLYIGNVVAPDDTCAFAANSPALLQGTLDVAVPDNSYDATLRLVNQLTNLSQTGASGFPPMSDPNVIVVRQAEVEIQDIGGNPLAFAGGLPNPFTIPVGGVAVPSGDGMSSGEAVGLTQIVPAAYTADLAAAAGTDAQIIVSITAIGTTLGDAEVVSAPFTFPIQLCSGCLVTGCLMDEEGEPLCIPACDPGQDQVHTACDVTCTAGGI